MEELEAVSKSADVLSSRVVKDGRILFLFGIILIMNRLTYTYMYIYIYSIHKLISMFNVYIGKHFYMYIHILMNILKIRGS